MKDLILQVIEECNKQMHHSCHGLLQSFGTYEMREQDAAAQIANGNSIIAQFTVSLQHSSEKAKRKHWIMLRQVWTKQTTLCWYTIASQTMLTCYRRKSS